VEIPHHLKSPV